MKWLRDMSKKMTNQEKKTIIENHPILTKEETAELFDKYQESNPDYLSELMFNHNIRLIFWIKRKVSYLMDEGEYISLAWTAVCQAVNRFDHHKGAFSHFLTYYIRNATRPYYSHNKKHSVLTSLQTPIGDEGSILEDFIGVDADLTYDRVDDLVELLRRASIILSKKEYQIIELYATGMTLQEISEVLNTSKQFVSAYFHTSIGKLKHLVK